MRNWNVGNRLDFLELEDAQVGEPAMETKQRVMIGTQALGKALARDCIVKHPANRYAIDRCTLDTEADQPSVEELNYC